MTLVPPVAPATPTAQVSIAQHAQPTPPPVTLAVALTTNLDMTKPTAARVIVPATAPSPAVSAAEPIEANPAPVPAQPSPRPVGGAQEAHGAPAAPVVAAPVAAPAPRPAGSPAPAPPPASTSSATIPVEIEAAPSHVAKPAAPLPPSAASRPEPIKPSPASEPAASMPAALPRQSGADAVELVKSICQRFHLVARQLRLRGEYRPTVAVEDECDAQDLLHALLRLHFDDIGTVEWTPADSLGVPRTVFLLNDGRLAVFVKKTRAGLNTRDLSEQLRLDVERCGTLKRCSALLCFVYDPEGRIGNPRGLESDLISVSDQLTVDVYVAPK